MHRTIAVTILAVLLHARAGAAQQVPPDADWQALRTENFSFEVIGRASYDTEQLQENAQTLLEAVRAAKPSSSKGAYLRKITVTTSMGHP
jgi:hypothetical protein